MNDFLSHVSQIRLDHLLYSLIFMYFNIVCEIITIGLNSINNEQTNFQRLLDFDGKSKE